MASRWRRGAEGYVVVDREDLLVRFATAIATSPVADTLSARLCHACRDLAGSDAAAITVSYTSASRVTLCATDEVSGRLEDLQDVVGEGPGRAASESGRIEVCPVGRAGVGRWSHFDEAAQELVDSAVLHAVPMRPDGKVFGVLTLYQTESLPGRLALDDPTLLMLAGATGAALIRDPTALDEELLSGPWASRARIHQATGMVVAQLGLSTDDALAVLRAHAYAGGTSLSDIAEQVTGRSLRFTPQ
jgi:hypothetical protein